MIINHQFIILFILNLDVDKLLVYKVKVNFLNILINFYFFLILIILNIQV